jgi:hypothetical protein
MAPTGNSALNLSTIDLCSIPQNKWDCKIEGLEKTLGNVEAGLRRKRILLCGTWTVCLSTMTLTPPFIPKSETQYGVTTPHQGM